jgi:NADP-dependent 3-hydroxy acid dehydrogenase YdfG
MILITGASSGIGWACAEIFAKEGKDLFLVARRGERLRSLKEKLEKETGVQVHWATLDISQKNAVQAFSEEHAALLDRVTVLVNNAGLARGLDTIQEGNTDDWDVMWDTNVKGLLYLTRAVLPYFVKKKTGHIVNMGSVASRWAYPKGNIYAATKRAVSSLTESLRLDLMGTGIRVSEIAPGMAETEFSVVRLGDEKKAKAVYEKMQPLTARDVAEAVSWVVSRPAHVNIQEVVIYPTDQASTSMVFRR